MSNKIFPHMPEPRHTARDARKTSAIAQLEKGYEERDFRLTLLGVAFEFDGMRSDPKFKELVRRMGLPE